MPKENEKNLLPRPPIVVVMGHVDHGKTTLLDHIRKTNVAAREAGGITQSIGAYEIEHGGKKITFIDTPGHEAFIRMRTRGAHAADLAILVVAADEGVKPQTQESVKILQETTTPFVVAITKTDKTNADLERVKNELAAAGVLLEGYGGQISYQPISAKTGEHVSELLDLVLLTADLEHLTFDPSAPGSGYILEAKMDRQRGLEATLIVKDGALSRGDSISTATAKGKVKILEDFRGAAADRLVPSAPALVIGFEKLPQVGEEFTTGERAASDAAPASAPAARAAAGTEKELLLTLILKAADSGTLEALSQIVRALPLPDGGEKRLKILGESVGEVNDNDVKLAISGGATILAFGSRVDKSAKALAEANRVRIISSEVIYELVKAIEDHIAALGKPASAGELEVLAVFNQAKPEKQVVGGRVTRGVFRNKAAFDIARAGASVGTGRVTNLQSQKKDAHQVDEGNEAGLLVNSNVLIQVGDTLVIKN